MAVRAARLVVRIVVVAAIPSIPARRRSRRGNSRHGRRVRRHSRRGLVRLGQGVAAKRRAANAELVRVRVLGQNVVVVLARAAAAQEAEEPAPGLAVGALGGLDVVCVDAGADAALLGAVPREAPLDEDGEDEEEAGIRSVNLYKSVESVWSQSLTWPRSRQPDMPSLADKPDAGSASS